VSIDSYMPNDLYPDVNSKLNGIGHKIYVVMLCVVQVHPSARAFYGVGLRPLTRWDCGFESRREHR
jgi:hypothetical protein